MAVEEATDAKIPLIGEEVDLTSPVQVLVLVVSLVGGWTIFHMTSDIGQNAAGAVNNFIADISGVNPATGDSTDSGGAFD